MKKMKKGEIMELIVEGVACVLFFISLTVLCGILLVLG